MLRMGIGVSLTTEIEKRNDVRTPIENTDHKNT